MNLDTSSVNLKFLRVTVKHWAYMFWTNLFWWATNGYCLLKWWHLLLALGILKQITKEIRSIGLLALSTSLMLREHACLCLSVEYRTYLELGLVAMVPPSFKRNWVMGNNYACGLCGRLITALGCKSVTKRVQVRVSPKVQLGHWASPSLRVALHHRCFFLKWSKLGWNFQWAKMCGANFAVVAGE